MLDGLFKWLLPKKRNPEPEPTPPLWQLVPDRYGTFTLRRWNFQLREYVAEAHHVADEKEADIIIERLTRPPLIR